MFLILYNKIVQINIKYNVDLSKEMRAAAEYGDHWICLKTVTKDGLKSTQVMKRFCLDL